MVEVTVQEAKTHLSRLLRKVEAGESVIIRRGNQRVAVLSPAPPAEQSRRIWDDLQGSISEDFDDLPDDFTTYQ